MRNQGSYEIAGRNIFFALPAYDFKVSLKLATSLVKFAMIAPQYGVTFQIGSICGCSVVSRARNLLAKDFLASDCTDLMFIDSDINFEPEDVIRLIAWSSDPKKGIVAGIPVARKKGKVFISTLDMDEAGCVQMNSMGLVKAKRVATAFMMVQRKVFEDMDAKIEGLEYWDENTQAVMKSFFDFKSTPQGYIGEDYLFCDRARELGHEVWIDPTIKLGHMGIEEFQGSFGEDWLYPRMAPIDAQKGVA
jgi:hypothetical protein